MRKMLIALLSLSFLSTLALAQDQAAVGNDEDTLQTASAPAVQAPVEDVATVDIEATETKAAPQVAPAAPVAAAPAVQPVQQVQQTEPVAPAPVAQNLKPMANVQALQESPRVNQSVQNPIDVDGNYNIRPVATRPVTQAERMKAMRARLEKQNEILVRKQMERMRLKQEMEMSKRIQKTFDDSMKKLDNLE